MRSLFTGTGRFSLQQPLHSAERHTIAIRSPPFRYRPWRIESPTSIECVRPATVRRAAQYKSFARVCVFCSMHSIASIATTATSHIALSILMSVFPFLIVVCAIAAFIGSVKLADESRPPSTVESLRIGLNRVSVTANEKRLNAGLSAGLIGRTLEFAAHFSPAWQRGHPMSGRRSRTKGIRTERSIVALLKASGVAAERVPLSGAVGGRFAGDIVLPLLGRNLCVEVKCRAQGFRELYAWLDGRDALIVKADRQEPLVVVRLSLAAEVAKLIA
jgi:hypothetical protein